MTEFESPLEMITVAIVEDDPDIRESLAILIDGSSGFRCLHRFDSVEACIKPIVENPPNVVLMDIELPGATGIEGVRMLKEKLPKLDIVMLTVHEDDESVFNSLCAGASGYLPKNTPPGRLLEAIAEVQRGGAPMGTKIARMVIGSFKQEKTTPLSMRENDVLDQLCKGASYKEIADTLFVSEETVRSHIKSIYHKLEVHSKAEAVAKAMRTNLVRK